MGILTKTFSDDFNNNSVSSSWNNWGGSQVVETSQRIEMSNSLAGNYVGMDTDSKGARDLTGSYVLVQILDVGSRSITSWEVYPIYVTIYGDGTNQVFWLILSDNTLRAYKKVAGVTTILLSGTYDPNVHKWFRIRENSGTIYFDYSTDGITWTNFTSLANPFAITNVTIGMEVGTWQAEGSTTKALFDNFNFIPPVAKLRNSGTRPRPFAPGIAR